jgi:hypothetical protein
MNAFDTHLLTIILAARAPLFPKGEPRQIFDLLVEGIPGFLEGIFGFLVTNAVRPACNWVIGVAKLFAYG